MRCYQIFQAQKNLTADFNQSNWPMSMMTKKLILLWVVLIGLMLLGHSTFFVGYLASDDMLYLGQSSRYLSGDFSLPRSHWGFRYPVVIPLTLLGLSFEYTERLLAAVPLTYWFGSAFLMTWFIGRELGYRQSVYAGLLVATLPLFVVQSSILGVDIAEAFFLFAAFAVFYLADVSREQRYRAYFLVGVLAGLGMLTRESAYGFLLVLVVFFLLGGWRRWRCYVIALVGVVLILSLEWMYYLAAGEGVLYRILTISTSHGTVGLKEGGFQAGSGNISDSRIYGPVLALLVNQEFALLYWAAALSVIYLYRQADFAHKSLLKYTCISFVIYFLWIGYSGAVRPLPRYFAFPSMLAILPIVLMLGAQKSKLARYSFLIVIVGTNILALSVENVHPRFAARSVGEFASGSSLPVVSDRRTASQANSFMRFSRGPKSKVSSDAPTGVIYVFGLVDGMAPPAEIKSLLTKESLLAESIPPKLLIGHVLELFGFGRLLPRNLYQYLAIRNPTVRFYRIDAAGIS